MAEKKSPPKKFTVQFDVESLRLKLGMKKIEFARMVGLSNTGYHGLAKSPTQVRMETLEKIINVTGCKIEDLFRVESAE
jgi:DNA-binding Xre family transcriptional regulator